MANAIGTSMKKIKELYDYRQKQRSTERLNAYRASTMVQSLARTLVTTLSPSRDAADSSVTIARDELDLDDEVLHY